MAQISVSISNTTGTNVSANGASTDPAVIDAALSIISALANAAVAVDAPAAVAVAVAAEVAVDAPVAVDVDVDAEVVQ